MSEPVRWRVTVDGAPREVPAGGTVLEALRRLGHDVPTLCKVTAVRIQGMEG